MKKTKLDERFFESMRGRIVSLLRDGSSTVNELASKLELTDERGETLIIRSGGCPLAAAVAEHPEACQLAEALMAEVIRFPVRESCHRGGESPKCRFEIGESG